MRKFRFLALIMSISLLIGCGSNAPTNRLEGFKTWSLETEEELTEIRETYKIEELVAGCKTDYERTVKIVEWVSGLWEHDGMNVPEHGNPLYILDQVVNHGKRYRCVEYGVVIYGCLLSIMYVPEGGKEVTIFQRDYEINIDKYLHDVDMFYGK